jgi:3-oxoacyl-[acyl-carrier-protein] synthase II
LKAVREHVSARRVLITGVGARTAYEGGAAGLFKGLVGGLTGLGVARSFDTLPLDVAYVGEVTDNIEQGLRGDRKSALALSAAIEALEMAGLIDQGALVGGIWLGTGLSSVTPEELIEDVFPNIVDGELVRDLINNDVANNRLAPLVHLPELTCEMIAERIGCLGGCYTSFSACAAGAQAIAEAFRAVRRGDVDVAVCGGHDSMVHPLGMLSFAQLGALSSGCSRPFDSRRDGFVLGEGAGVLVIESEASAAKRGVTPIAEIVGAGGSIDAFQPTAPHPEGAGATAAMKRALDDAGVVASDVDHINAHGTGTPVGDRAEAQAIAGLFGSEVGVSSIKGAVGHCIASAGAVEAVAMSLGIRDGYTFGTIGCEQPEDWPISIQLRAKQDYPSLVLSNSMGFGGQNCSLLFSSVHRGS